MTRDDLAPLGESEPFPCPRCNGTGIRPPHRNGHFARCSDCGGSGYGPPPPTLEQTRAHCLRRLAEWAQHTRITEEN